jgi:murein DD-endopeptidase MepM/ murein hydrolase activator NlpD
MTRGTTSPVRAVMKAVVVTSLGWIAIFAVWLVAGEPGVGRFAGVAPTSLAASPGPGAPMQSAGGLVIPVAGVMPRQLTDTFTQGRAAGARQHDAIDIMAPRGAPVVAAAAGRVEKLFVSGDGGNTIYVRSADGARLYYYAHLDGYAPGLAEGAMVRAGDRLGMVGSTGNADPAAPHLHFAIAATRPEAKWYEPGQAINPYPLLALSLAGAADARR